MDKKTVTIFNSQTMYAEEVMNYYAITKKTFETILSKQGFQLKADYDISSGEMHFLLPRGMYKFRDYFSQHKAFYEWVKRLITIYTPHEVIADRTGLCRGVLCAMIKNKFQITDTSIRRYYEVDKTLKRFNSKQIAETAVMKARNDVRMALLNIFGDYYGMDCADR